MVSDIVTVPSVHPRDVRRPVSARCCGARQQDLHPERSGGSVLSFNIGTVMILHAALLILHAACCADDISPTLFAKCRLHCCGPDMQAMFDILPNIEPFAERWAK